MESERKAIASERRSEGAAEAEKIRANADRQRVGLLAQAYKQAQDIKGIGDAKAASAYADAFGRTLSLLSSIGVLSLQRL